MKALIVDDEVKSRETLKMLLDHHCEGVTVVGMAKNVTEALSQIQVTLPDILFLDISMPGGTGFDLLKNFDEVPFEVIFVTAYDNYGLQAIKANALDYLMKPVSIAELRKAIAKAARRMEQKQSAGHISSIVKQMEQKIVSYKKLAIPTGDGLMFVNTQEVISLTAEGSYTRLSLSSGRKILSTHNLKMYEKMLPAASFIRVHNTHIINLDHVQRYYRGEGGSVSMSDNSHIFISKRKKKEFLDRFRL